MNKALMSIFTSLWLFSVPGFAQVRELPSPAGQSGQTAQAGSADLQPASQAAGKVKLLRTPNGGLQPQVALDERGVLHMVYFTGEPQGGDIYYVRRDEGKNEFTSPLRVNSEPGSAIAERLHDPDTRGGWNRSVSPHNGLACAICLIKALTCALTGGRPESFRRESLVQKSLNPSRCQRRTVSGLTIKRAERH
jgi:hypothetical protein